MHKAAHYVSVSVATVAEGPQVPACPDPLTYLLKNCSSPRNSQWGGWMHSMWTLHLDPPWCWVLAKDTHPSFSLWADVTGHQTQPGSIRVPVSCKDSSATPWHKMLCLQFQYQHHPKDTEAKTTLRIQRIPPQTDRHWQWEWSLHAGGLWWPQGLPSCWVSLRLLVEHSRALCAPAALSPKLPKQI